MTDEKSSIRFHRESINRGFTKQSAHYDHDDQNNRVLKDLRSQVYSHVEKYLKPSSRILEINAGTGLDACYFVVSRNHRVHAIDLSDGMIHELQEKIRKQNLGHALTCQQLSYTELDTLVEGDFDYVFSNFGGLNCISDISLVTRHLPALMKDGAYLTMVIMPRVSLWELALVLKGNFRRAFRRLRREGTIAHVEGEYFRTYYHSLATIREKLQDDFRFVASESLALISPPPHRQDLPVKFSRLYGVLRSADNFLRCLYPFNRWGDHIIVTFRCHKSK